MLLLLPLIFMILTALGLFILNLVRPEFKYHWIIACGGATLAFASIFLWRIDFPLSISLPSWQLLPDFRHIPAWFADDFSWPYALSLAALPVAVIWTSVVRTRKKPLSWAGTLVIAALGILAVTAENPIALLLAWSAIDISELVAMLRSTDGEDQIVGVIIAFAVRLAGTGLVIWADMASFAGGAPLDFRNMPANAGIYLLIAAGLRLGVLPLHLPYRKDDVIRRGFGTTIRLVSAAASLALLGHIPVLALKSVFTPYLLGIVAIAALFSGWMWLRSSDEILGRPFWIAGMASMAVAESIRGNPTGSIGWGVALILCGGVLFLFSARQRSILWLPILGLWMLSALPFSLTATSWQQGYSISWLFVIPFLFAQALLMAGYLRHAIHPGETSLESQEKWVKMIYPIGLLLLIAIGVVLGTWSWPGAMALGLWWFSCAGILLAAGFTFLDLRFLVRRPQVNISSQWTQMLRLHWFTAIVNTLYRFLLGVTDAVTSLFEGEGGLLWAFLLLILILSILSAQNR